MLAINTTPTLYSSRDKAASIADKLQMDDEDWEYRVVTYESGWTAIEIYDEDGYLIAKYGEN